MSSKNINTHAFDWYFKMLPTNQYSIITASWWYNSTGSNLLTNPSNKGLVAGYYNTYGASMTRQSASLGGMAGYQVNPGNASDPVVNASESAFPWVCAAHDFLWNVSFWSMSFVERSEFSLLYTDYDFQTTTKSHFTGSLSKPSYPITTSWHPYEPKFSDLMGKTALLNTSGTLFHAVGSGSGGGAVRFPASAHSNPQFSTPVAGYSLPHSASSDRPKWVVPFTQGAGDSVGVGRNPDWVFYDASSVADHDGRFFDLGGGVGIMRAQVSASLVSYKDNTGTSAGSRALATEALKKRRLYFPTVATGSVFGTSDNYNEHLQRYTGVTSNEMFDENGGIYNVKFNLKKDTTLDYFPDSGTELLVYIFNVNPTSTNQADKPASLPIVSSRVPGTPGFYPPESNIVRVKNQPVMSFINPSTGFQIETFNINIIQYGTPAQLCFEASGSLEQDTYFGCVIDDVEFCKVGVTEDPNLIAPETVGSYIVDEGALPAEGFAGGGG